MRPQGVKLGLFRPPALHDRMIAAAGPSGLSAAYALALARLLDRLDAGEVIAFAAVRGVKKRVTVRIDQALCDRLRARLPALSLKITDFACAAVDHHLSSQPGA
jgi:hypothetical protein